jgi:hypothetical protein
MTNGIILPLSWADGQGITASSAASSYLAAENLLNEQPSIPWRSDGSGTHTLSGAFGPPRPCSVGVLWGHNLAAADTVTWELANDAGMTADLVHNQYPGRVVMRDSDGPAGGDGDGIYRAPYTVAVVPQVERAYWRWTIDRSAGYSQVGRMMIGLGWQPRYNFDWGLSLTPQSPSIVTRTIGGQTYSTGAPKYRTGHIQWSWLDEADAADYWDILHRCAVDRLVLLIPYPDALDTQWGRQQTVLARILDHEGPRETEHGYGANTLIEEAL